MSATDNKPALSGPQLAYSIEHFAKVTDLSRAKLYQEAKAGRLRLTKAGRRTLITRENGVAYLQSLSAA